MHASSLRVISVSLLLLALSVACQPGPGGVGFEVAIFPGEGRLGSSAAMMVDSNYFPWNDYLERYDVEPDRVLVVVDPDGPGPIGAASASVRAVFPFQLAHSSVRSKTNKGEWGSMVLFDLPTTAPASWNPLGFPINQALISAYYDSVAPENYISGGTFRIVNTGGSPWRPPDPGYTPLERTFETRSLLRLRAVHLDELTGLPSEGFQDGWEVGAIEVEVQYPLCLKPPNAYSNSEAANATVILGPGGPADYPDFQGTVKVVMVDPKGFFVKKPADPYGVLPNVAGQGPILDVAFDRYANPGLVCNHLNADLFKVRKLYVTDKNGEMKIDRRSGNTDSSDLLTMFILDAEASS